MSKITSLFCATIVIAGCALAADPVALPKPQTNGGKPLMEVLQLRKSTREYSPEKLSPQMLSNLLWAAFGANRPDGRRTAPSASNRQEIDIYLAMADGVYRYDAKAHRLEPVLDQDVRKATGSQDFVATAPLNFVYVADLSKMGGGSLENKVFYAAANTGFIAENVYLFCASEGLATVVRGSVDRDALAKTLKLTENQRIQLAQTVGFPKK